jgi:molybdopterin/thiamine biosynthesis adenylyltransferase
VLEGADNFPTKFLAADACYLEGKPIVHGAAVRFVGTVLSVAAQAAPCYRCLFEDILDEGQAPNCSEAGVMGPVVGIVGALMADLALDVLLEDPSRQGTIYSLDGKKLVLRPVTVPPRATCMLCGTDSPSPISEVHLGLYSRDHIQCKSADASAPPQQL